uniref:BtpA family membrane complex biogenesis protein n=1 Tax=Ornithorhynchus anatinus TaxID=9258 RepID=A0A6I8NKZ2_ORNAN
MGRAFGGAGVGTPGPPPPRPAPSPLGPAASLGGWRDGDGVRFPPQDGLIVENTHDLPYTASAGPEVTATMTAVCAAVRMTCPRLPLGVQVLCSANQEAVAVALAAGCDFIRAEGFVFSHVADEGFVNACAGDLLRYRRRIGAEHVQIFADIKKKHSAHALTADVSVSETAKAAEFFLADGVILTGPATGVEADPGELHEVEQAVNIPLLIGSGVTLENVKSYLNANALIIGSYFKEGGYWANQIDPTRRLFRRSRNDQVL